MLLNGCTPSRKRKNGIWFNSTETIDKSAKAVFQGDFKNAIFALQSYNTEAVLRANNPNYSTTDKNRIPAELKTEVGVFQEKLNYKIYLNFKIKKIKVM